MRSWPRRPRKGSATPEFSRRIGVEVAVRGGCAASISESSKKSDAGGRLVGQAGSTMDEIVQSTDEWETVQCYCGSR